MFEGDRLRGKVMPGGDDPGPSALALVVSGALVTALGFRVHHGAIRGRRALAPAAHQTVLRRT